METGCPVKLRSIFQDVTDEAGSVADTVEVEGLAAATVVEGVAVAALAVQGKILRLSRTARNARNASSV